MYGTTGRKKRGRYAGIVVLLLLACVLPAMGNGGVWAAARGIRVEAWSREGTKKEIRLYSGYYALVVGCGAYRNGWPRLPNPVKDAADVARTLEKLGFQVELIKNPESRVLRRALNRLVAKVGRDPQKGILFYFAGHGHTLRRADGKKLGYIVPVDAPDPEQDLMGFMEKAISMQELEQLSVLVSAKHVMMIFDSCFSGAIFALTRAKPPRHIEEQVSKPVRLFITAGSENEQVPDQSVFKTNFLQGLTEGYADLNKDGYVTGQELGSYLQDRVINYTDGAQHPQFGKIRNPKLDKGDFVFVLHRSSSPAPSSFPPASQAAGKHRPGALRISTSPEGAAVYVNGVREGTSPVRVPDLEPGRITVRVVLDGYGEVTEKVRIRAGRETRLNFRLTPLKQSGSLEVNSDPSGAEWYLDGDYVGLTPDTADEVEIGTHEIRVTLEGYQEWSRKIRVRADRKTKVFAELEPQAEAEPSPRPSPAPRTAPGTGGGTPAAGGTYLFQDPWGTVSLPVPRTWISPDPRVFQQIRQATPWYVLNATDPATRAAVDVYVFGVFDPQQCLNMLTGFAYSMGIAFSYGQGRTIMVARKNAILVPVSFTNNRGPNEGELVLVPTNRGYVGILFSTPAGYYASARPGFARMLNQARFAP